MSQHDSAISPWWTTAENCLTPTKETLTAAQQDIQETKDKEKHEKEEAKKVGKGVKASHRLARCTSAQPCHARQALAKGHVDLSSAVPNTWGSKPSGLLPIWHQASYVHLVVLRHHHLTPHPMNLLYLVFTDQGMLDVPGTLVVIARHFKKLENWTHLPLSFGPQSLVSSFVGANPSHPHPLEHFGCLSPLFLSNKTLRSKVVTNNTHIYEVQH